MLHQTLYTFVSKPVASRIEGLLSHRCESQAFKRFSTIPEVDCSFLVLYVPFGPIASQEVPP